MYDFLWFPIGVLGGLAAYSVWSRLQATQKEAPCSTKVSRKGPSANALASVRIIDITPTNNSYDPMGDVLSDLDIEGVQIILGKALRTDMEGYIK